MPGKYAYAARDALSDIGQPANIDRIWAGVRHAGYFPTGSDKPTQTLRNEIRKNCEGVDHIRPGDRRLMFYQPSRGLYGLIEWRDLKETQNVERQSQLPISEPIGVPPLLEGLDAADTEYREGAVETAQVKRYRRDPGARNACIDYWGPDCAVCGFSFSDKYGQLGVGFITVHHITPLSQIGADYEVDPKRELCPVCPNCHAMLHRGNSTISIEDLKRAIQENE